MNGKWLLTSMIPPDNLADIKSRGNAKLRKVQYDSPARGYLSHFVAEGIQNQRICCGQVLRHLTHCLDNLLEPLSSSPLQKDKV